ncbi:Flp1 family type IVb pilin [Eshraghiella crossota]|uniref:Flp1 family type IVb pilin n=1 Tax=Eshraghiella crossota TaxID=45851 RepID=UPI003FEF5A43
MCISHRDRLKPSKRALLEIIVIVVLISLVLIFKTQITAVVKNIFIKITNDVAGI